MKVSIAELHRITKVSEPAIRRWARGERVHLSIDLVLQAGLRRLAELPEPVPASDLAPPTSKAGE